MTDLWWQTSGEGKTHLVLVHGWGLNAAVWQGITAQLSPHFTLHLVDLPGFGRSQNYGAMTLEEMANVVLQQAPERAVWMGWSLGGLVASQVALAEPSRVDALVTVASSPCFQANEHEGWPGIKGSVLQGFQQQLSEDFRRTVERFLALQTLGTASARQDARALKEVVLSQPFPTPEVLNGGLAILEQVDLREALDNLNVPFWRLYGYLDGLVPRKAAQILDSRWQRSASVVFPKAAHAPFISHPDLFCEQLLALTSGLRL